MKSKRPIVAIVVLVALAAAAFALLRSARSEQSDGSLRLFGNVDIRQVELGFRVPGRIAEVLVDEGVPVAEGDVLARLDERAYEDAVRAARAELAMHEAALAKLEAGTRPAEIAQARAMVAERLAAVENARMTHERHEQLLRTGAIARAAYDESDSALRAAEARLASARKSLQLAVEGARTEDVAGARARVEAARAKLASAETALADTRLAAPSGGVVLSRVREKGAIVSPADTVFVLSLTRPVWVRAYVSETELGRVHPGLEVEVFTDSAPERPYRGRVGFVSPVAEFTPKSVETAELRTELVYRLRVVVDEPDEGLRQGMPVTVRVAPKGP